MDQLNKLVSESLKQQPSGPHPGADTLAAFAENALGRPARQQTVAHLAGCADCREVLYLAQPDSAATQLAVAYRPNPVTHFALRWGAVAASLVIVAGGLFITRHEFRTAQHAVSQQKPASPAYYDNLAEKKAPPELDSLRNAEAPAQKQLSAAVTKTRPPEKHMTAKPQANMSFDESGQVRVLNKRKTSGDLSAPGSVSGMNANARIASEEKRSRQRDESAPMNAPSALAINGVGGEATQNRIDAKDSPAAAAAAESVQVSASAPAVQTEEAERAVGAGSAAKPDDLQKDKRASMQAGAFMKALAAPVASWELAPNGAVRRSLDSGKTWQGVSVGGKGAAFRAVFSSGSQVWVGGTAGALYHSADSGLTWAQVVPAADGQNLKTDISHIEFSDPQNGSILAANGETWLTADGGQTWRRKSISPAH
ncbi:MAG TPA: hypothetical protein VGL74_13030 [Terriglobales bacterium]|jgi:hypothetical protein